IAYYEPTSHYRDTMLVRVKLTGTLPPFQFSNLVSSITTDSVPCEKMIALPILNTSCDTIRITSASFVLQNGWRLEDTLGNAITLPYALAPNVSAPLRLHFAPGAFRTSNDTLRLTLRLFGKDSLRSIALHGSTRFPA